MLNFVKNCEQFSFNFLFSRIFKRAYSSCQIECGFPASNSSDRRGFPV